MMANNNKESTIDFTGPLASGTHVIALASALPDVTADGTQIADNVAGGQIIEIDGTSAGNIDCAKKAWEGRMRCRKQIGNDCADPDYYPQQGRRLLICPAGFRSVFWLHNWSKLLNRLHPGSSRKWPRSQSVHLAADLPDGWSGCRRYGRLERWAGRRHGPSGAETRNMPGCGRRPDREEFGRDWASTGFSLWRHYDWQIEEHVGQLKKMPDGKA
jgi:hypothetical protein